MPTLPKSEPRSDGASSSPRTRLPVNPRRNKVLPEERKRVATACNNCNVRRIKCSGHKPCQQCASGTRDCEYPEPVVKKTIPQREYDDLLLMSRCAAEAFAAKSGHAVADPLSADERKRADVVLLAFINAPLAANPSAGSTAEPSVKMELGDTQSASEPPDAAFGRSSIVAGEGRGQLLEDDAGTKRYLGRASGPAYIDSIKAFMGKTSKVIAASRDPANPLEFDSKFLSSRGRYHTFDSRPLKLPAHVDPLELPPDRQDMARMLKVVRDCLQDGSGGGSGGGIFFWPVDEVENLETAWRNTIGLRPRGSLPTPSDRWLAKFQAAFALATLLTQRAPGSRVEGQMGDVYFERASRLLGNPLDVGNQFRLEDVPAMTLMAMYLLETNRREKACHYISMARNVCVEHGADSVAPGSPLQEGQQRVFWTFYILDRWLSCLMGRPPYYPDDASSMVIPKPQACPGLPPPEGLRAHVELSEISTYIVRNNYKEPYSLDEVSGFVDEAQAKLKAWQDGLPEILRKGDSEITGWMGSSGARRFNKKNVDRPVCMLHMAHNQLYILTVRPMFLAMVQRKVARAATGAAEDENLSSTERDVLRKRETMLADCAEFARDTVWLALTARDRSNGLVLVQDLHNLFNAAIILMLNQMYSSNLRTADNVAITEAIGLFQEEAKTENAYCMDCTEVLTDLRRLVNQLRPAIFEGVPIKSPLQRPLAHGEGVPAGRAQTGGSGTEMDIDTPAFALPDPGMINGHGQVPDPGMINGHGQVPDPRLDIAQVFGEFERWKRMDAMSLYTNVSCMVDMGKAG